MVVNGNRIPGSMLKDFSNDKKQEFVRLYDNDRKFIGIYTYIEDTEEYKPIKLFMD